MAPNVTSGLTVEELLESLPGTSYMTTPEGTITAISRRPWVRFAISNRADGVANPDHWVGRNVLEAMVGNDVKDAYQSMMRALCAQERDEVGFAFRCDAPEVAREMYMAIRPVKQAGRIAGLLFQALVLNEWVRPPVGLFDVRRQAPPGAPMLGICSYCAKVRFPAGQTQGEWMSAEDYYRRGGTNAVLLSHGICPRCYEKLVLPKIPR